MMACHTPPLKETRGNVMTDSQSYPIY